MSFRTLFLIVLVCLHLILLFVVLFFGFKLNFNTFFVLSVFICVFRDNYSTLLVIVVFLLKYKA